MSSGISFPIRSFSVRKQLCPSTGLLHDTTLTSQSALLCRSLTFFNNIGTDPCYASDTHELPFTAPVGAKSCYSSFLPKINRFEVTLESNQKFPSSSGLELNKGSILKKITETYAPNHSD